MAVKLTFGEAEKLVLHFCEAEKLLIWPMMMCNVAGKYKYTSFG